MVDLAAIDSLQGIEETAAGLRIGAMTTLRDVSRNELVKAHYGLLVEAANRVASPQIRNQGTIGGNVVQDTPLLVLPSWTILLQSRWKHLLCRQPRGDEPGTRHLRRESLRCRQPVGHSDCARRSGRDHGGSERLQRATHRGG